MGKLDEILEGLFHRGYKHGLSKGQSKDGEYYAASDAKRAILSCTMTDEDLKKVADGVVAPEYLTVRLGHELVKAMRDCFLRHLRSVRYAAIADSFSKQYQYDDLLSVADGLYESLSDSLRIKTGVTASGNCKTLLCTVGISEAVKAYKKWKKRAASKRTA